MKMTKQDWQGLANSCIDLHELLVSIAVGKGAPLPHDRMKKKIAAAKKADKLLLKVRNELDNLVYNTKFKEVEFFGETNY